MRSRSASWVLALVVLTALLAPACRHDDRPAQPRPDVTAYSDALTGHLSGVEIEVTGTVKDVLPDDTKPPRHERFIVLLPDGHTLLVAHDIDLAPRVPLAGGETLLLHGQYEWNGRGGVLHWTHRDPSHVHPEGFIELAGKTYR